MSHAVDLRKCPEWASLDLWLCDIQELETDKGFVFLDKGDTDFLFLAKISSDGDCHKTNGKGRCILHNRTRMYDIQSFQEDTVFDGSLDFAIHFGKNTKERSDAPQGWTVEFKKLTQDTGSKGNRYSGKIMTSWWGERDVKLINYVSLSDSEKQQFPDLVVPAGGYYVTQK